MNKKGQAAMEFLMTYGWAILVVLAAIGALAYFGVLSPSALLPERTTFTAPIPSVDTAVIQEDGTITIAFRNNVGSQIEIKNVTAADEDCGGPVSESTEVSVEGGAFASTPVSVNNGQAFRVRFTCTNDGNMDAGQRFKSGITILYENMETNLERPHTGGVEGRIVQ